MNDRDAAIRRRWRVFTVVIIAALCFLADAFVLRSTWTSLEPLPGQLRRGFFERFDGTVGLAIDDLPGRIFPSFVLAESGWLEVPPGMTAVTALEPGASYELKSDSPHAPYIVVASEAPVAPAAPHLSVGPREARLVAARTLAVKDGRLQLVGWEAARPWREDAAMLAALRSDCEGSEVGRNLTVRLSGGQLEIRLGRCTLSEPLEASERTLLAALTGPDWVALQRTPRWVAERRIVWQVLAIIVAKVTVIGWALGLPSAAAVSLALAVAAVRVPVDAVLTWPLTLIVGGVAAAVKGALILRRRLPRRWHVASALTALAVVVGAAGWWNLSPSSSLPPISPPHGDHGQPFQCAVLGYSMAGGDGLRDPHGGFRGLLDDNCQRCRDMTAGLFAGGEVLSWARDAYCASPRSFGRDGHVIFLGAANDDFFWGVTSLARVFIVGQQGSEAWARNMKAAAAASLAKVDAQVAAIDGLAQCIRTHGAGFLFLHDFMATDLVAGRDADRAVMLARRRAAVEAAGGTFVDLYQAFAGEAGVSWFNDYVHLSLIGHERVADLTCRSIH